MEIALSKNSEEIKVIKSLLTQSKPHNLFLVEDLFSLSLGIKYFNPKRIESVFYVSEMEYSDEAKEILNFYKKNSKNVYTISYKTFESLQIKENVCGIIALIEKEFTNINEINGNRLLVLDHLEVPGNIGTLIRTADACGFTDIVMVDSITKINNVKVLQSSRGMVLTKNIYECSYDDIQKVLLEKGYDIYLGEPKLGKMHTEYEYNNKLAIVIGNERFGINPKWYHNEHLKVYLPMEGIMESLNVSVAGSVLMYEVYMKNLINR